MPTTSYPALFRSPATTEESTPPDIATTTRARAASPGSSIASCTVRMTLSHNFMLVPGRRQRVMAQRRDRRNFKLIVHKPRLYGGLCSFGSFTAFHLPKIVDCLAVL